MDIAGVFYAIDADTGQMLNRIPLNAAGVSGVSLGHDARGQMTIFLASGGARPGIIVALAPTGTAQESAFWSSIRAFPSSRLDLANWHVTIYENADGNLSWVRRHHH